MICIKHVVHKTWDWFFQVLKLYFVFASLFPVSVALMVHTAQVKDALTVVSNTANSLKHFCYIVKFK